MHIPYKEAVMMNLDDIEIDPAAEAPLLELLERIAEYRGPGYQVALADSREALCTLQNRGLIRYGQEPLGTYDAAGCEEYGTIAHILGYGDEELAVQQARRDDAAGHRERD